MKTLEILLDSSRAPLRRWSGSLRWWRNRRGLRDCLFGDSGNLGLDFDEPREENGYKWVLRDTHPPASMLDIKKGMILEGINLERVNGLLSKADIGRRIQHRPINMVFAPPKEINDGDIGGDK